MIFLKVKSNGIYDKILNDIQEIRTTIGSKWMSKEIDEDLKNLKILIHATLGLRMTENVIDAVLRVIEKIKQDIQNLDNESEASPRATSITFSPEPTAKNEDILIQGHNNNVTNMSIPPED